MTRTQRLAQRDDCEGARWRHGPAEARCFRIEPGADHRLGDQELTGDPADGSGSATHLGGELFRARAGIDIRHIPYKGTGAIVPDLIGGRITMAIGATATFLPFVREGRLRALAVASDRRSPATPDLPTIGEAGYPGFDTSSWQAVLVPVKTPALRVRRLNQDIVKVIALPDVQARFAELAMDPVASTPAELARIIKSDMEKWAKVIRDSGVKVE